MKGIVTLDIVRKKKLKRIKGHNIISNGGLNFIAANAMSPLLLANSFADGDRISFSDTFYTAKRSSTYVGTYSDKDRSLGCALIGLGASALADVETNQSFLPIFASTGKVDANKVLAVASLGTTASSGVGKSSKSLGSSVVKYDRVGKRYEFPGGTGTGNVTAIAMLPASYKPGEVGFGGFITYDKIDDINEFADKSQGSTLAVAPGIDGLGLEVRMNYTDASSVSVHKRDLVTGEVTDGSAAGTWFPTTYEMLYGNMYDDGTYIYTVKYYRNSLTLEKYNKANNYSVTESYMNASYTIGRIVNYNGTISYVACSKAGAGYIYTIGGSAATYSNKTDLAAAILTKFGVTVPSDFVSSSTVKGFTLQSVGDKMALLVYTTHGSASDLMMDAYIFNDPTDVMGSLIAVIPCISMDTILWGYNGVYGAMKIGKNFELVDTYKNYGSMITCDASGNVGFNSSVLSPYNCKPGCNNAGRTKTVCGDSKRFVEQAGYGCYISMPGQYANWLSLKELTNAESKSAEAEFYVQYDYELSSTGQTPEDSLVTE